MTVISNLTLHSLIVEIKYCREDFYKKPYTTE